MFETAFNNFNDKASPIAARRRLWAGDAGHYYVSGNTVITLPWHPFPDVTLSINPEIGCEWYSSGVNANLGFFSDTYWDVGLDINYKAITLDLRYWDTNIKPDPTYGEPVPSIICPPTSAASASSRRSNSTLRCRLK